MSDQMPEGSMRRREARALGRWCEEHDRKYERVPLDGGASATGCPDCLADPETAAALRRMIELVTLDPEEHHG